MTDKLLNFLGLCRRAGKLNIGNDLVIDDILKGQCRLVITACDLSKNTEKKILLNCHRNNVKALKVNRTKDELSWAVGKYCGVASVVDSGFAKKLVQLIENENQEDNV